MHRDARRSSKGAALLTLAVLVSGCAGGAPSAASPSNANGRDDADSRARAAQFAEEEAHILRQLATADPRIAARFGIAPTDDEVRKATLEALAADDETLALAGSGFGSGSGTAQSFDLFAFEARARVLSAAGEAVVRSNAELPHDAQVERDLLRRLVVAERARVERERTLGLGALPLLQGMAASWTRPETPDAAKARGRMLTKRFGEVRASLAAAKLTLMERDALDDALDPIERLSSDAGISEASSSIAELRIALGDLKTVPSKADADDALSRMLTAASGTAQSTKAVGDALTATSATLRALLKSRLAEMPASAREAMGSDAAHVLTGVNACPARASGSLVRTAVPPPERAVARDVVCTFASVKGEANAEVTVALIVAHDLVAMALWAFDAHARGLEPYRAEEAHTLLSALTTEYASRRLRDAIAEPAAAINGGLAVELLLRDGALQMTGRASRWLAFGDAPLDVVATALAAATTASGHDDSNATSPKASPAAR